MKTRVILFLVLSCCFTTIAFPQQTLYYQSIPSEVQKAKELYFNNDFITARELFACIIKKTDKKSERHTEAVFFEALCGLRTNLDQGENLMQKFLEENPESPYDNTAWFELGNARFRNNHYSQAISAYRNVNLRSLTKENQAVLIYRKGYAYFGLKKYDLAETEFAKIKDTNSKMAAPAKYYWGHINYLKYSYDNALNTFEQLKDDPAFSQIIPYYISQIYFMQGRYADVINMTEPLMETAAEQQKAALSRILGNSYFQLNQFDKAMLCLECYFNKTQSAKREENYMLGYCYYITKKYTKAIPFLEQASMGQDLLAQNAYYHLADSYIETGDKNKARIAFEAASAMDFNPDIKEDALFNYAKITYELSYSPFNETIRAFDKYIALYPNSRRNDKAYDYLVKVYMSTRNYHDAIVSIEKIKVKSPEIRKAYQRVTYYRGLELFNNLDYQSAIASLDKSLENGSYNTNLRISAVFWKAEAQYRLGNFDQAIAGYQSFLKLPGAVSRQDYQLAWYNLGYAFFKEKDYNSASLFFHKFIASRENNPGTKLGDACNRLADCYFINRDYKSAKYNYQKAFNISTCDPDYALFQIAVCEGLQKAQEQKINSLEKLLETFPESSFADDALYELGRTCERINKPDRAINSYQKLIKKFENSNLRSKALLQLGLVFYNQSDYKKSLGYYKQVVEKYPASEEVQPALLGIKNDYIELNQIDAYFAYTQKSIPEVAVSASERDSLTYQAAEKLVMSHNSKARAQLEYYLQQYPGGSFSINAHFYLGEDKYASGDYSAALSDYEYVLQKKDNIFTEQALAKASELEYNATDYDKAFTYYKRLESISSTPWNKIKAEAGQMRCLFNQEKFRSCIDAAQKVLGSGKLTDVLKREASYKLAKSLYQTGNYTKIFPLFKNLSKDTQSAEGAESKYLLTEILYNQNKLDEAENEVMDFIARNTPHQYWLAKSFILLADVYLAKGEEFEATHTLQSIIENYPEKDDGITDTANAKLKHLQEIEKQKQQKNDTPIKIDINTK